MLMLFCLTIATISEAQKHQDKRTIQLNTNDLNALHIYNMEGGVEVEGVDGNVASLTITRRLESSSSKRLELAKEEIYIDSLLDDGKMYFFIEAPNMNFEIGEDGSGGYHNWNMGSSNSKLRHFKIKYEFKWVVKIPRHLDLYVYNHREPLVVRDVEGTVKVSNHHDGVELTGMQNDVEAKSHHGDVEMTFVKNPQNSIYAKSHHGDIKIKVQDGFSGDVSMKSHHGDFYTDLDGEDLPPLVEVNKSEGKKTKYKFGESNRFRIGEGGVKLEFKTHHGDVFVTRS